MNLYSKKQRWKILLSIIGVLFIGAFLWYSNSVTQKLKEEQINHVTKWSQTIKKKADLVKLTNQTFDQLREEEIKKVSMWARALKEVEKNNLPDYDFSYYIISQTNNFPIILTDESDNHLSSINIALTSQNIKEQFQDKTLSEDSIQILVRNKFNDSIKTIVTSWAKDNEPFIITIDKNTTQKIYFRNSDKFYQLKHLRDSLIKGFNEDLSSNNAIVPFVFVDSSKNVIIATNLQGYTTKDSINSSIINKLIGYENTPITIALDQTENGVIHYANSPLIGTLKTLPYLQLFAVLIFIFIAYFLFSTFRKAEQNQVWVGMAKETAHQLGTPISSLMAWVELLKTQGIDASTTDEMQKDIVRLETITERFSKIGSESALLEDNFNTILEETIGYMKVRVSNKVKFNINLPSEDIIVKINKALFEWVMENLIKNAVDAMNGEGEITFSLSENDSKIILDVADTGQGIPQTKIKTIFEPGFTTKKRGWGLGLSLVKRIIEEYHNGKIFVKQSSAQGTIFRIVLNK